MICGSQLWFDGSSPFTVYYYLYLVSDSEEREEPITQASDWIRMKFFTDGICMSQHWAEDSLRVGCLYKNLTSAAGATMVTSCHGFLCCDGSQVTPGWWG